MYNEYNRYDDYDRHINNAEQYRRYTKNLQWNNRKGSGERWKMDDLIKRSDIDFDKEEFTPFDWAYQVNANYANYSISEKPEYYMEMANDDLHNDSYPERASERAYYDAQRRMARNDNRYYNVGHYEQYEYHPKSEPTYRRYEYDNRRYDERNTYRDRDNDGIYREGR